LPVPVVEMRSSTSVIKSETRSSTTSWSPTELEFLAPLAGENHEGIDPGQSPDTAEHGQRAHSNLFKAQEQADAILAAAEQQAAAIRQEARQAGYEEGRQAVEQELLQAARALNLAAEQAKTWQDELFSSAEAQLAALVVQISEKLFGQGFQLDDQALQSMLNHFIQRAKSLGELRCFLNPADIDTLQDGWLEREQAFHGIGIILVPDDSIQPGGCMIEGVYGSVDARLGTRLDAVLQALHQAGKDVQEDGE